MNKNSMIAALIAFSLVNFIYANIVYAQKVFPSSTVQLTKTALGMTAARSLSAAAAPIPPVSSRSEQDITKIKITSPIKGQQVPVRKDLTVSGTSIDNATSDCQVSVRVNRVSPYQPATSATATGSGGGGGGGAAAANDYSKWNYVLTSKYTTIKPGQNRITAKYECGGNAALTSFSSVNVTGVPAVVPVSRTEGATSSIAPQAVNGTNQRQHKPALITTAPPPATAPALPTPLSQLPKQTDSTGSGSVTTTNNVPIVVRPPPGGACPSGYHLVSGAVCIKDITPPTKTTPPPPPPSTTPITNATKSFSIPLASASRPNTTPANNDKNSADSNNEDNFNTKILKSFNKEFKRQER
ncbi:MAG: hypothetical protein ACJ72C_10505 [Nitrososphaeraceae archaeon]